MKKIIIEVEGEEDDLEYLSQKLNFEELNLVKKCYIESSGIIQDDENVYQNAESLIQNFNKILKLDPRAIGSLKIKEVIYEKEGQRIHESTNSLRAIVRIVGRDLGLDYKHLFKCNCENDRVREALIFFDQGYDWSNLYKAYETIRYDIVERESIRNKPEEIHKEIAERGWAEEEKLGIFYCTAHNFKLAKYGARHARRVRNSKELGEFCRKVMKDKKPMDLSEAIELIRNLTIKWINSHKI